MNKYIKYIPTKWIQDMVKQKESENNMCKLNLDKRLTHKPFTFFDVEECEKYIGKEGLFSDSPYDFEDIKNCGKGTLTHVATVDGFPVQIQVILNTFIIPTKPHTFTVWGSRQ